MSYVGYQTGLSAELIKWGGLLAGVFIGLRFTPTLGDALSNRTILSMEWARSFAMTSLVVGVYWVFTRVLRWVEQLVKFTFQERLNRVGGLLFGFLRGGFVTSVVLLVCRQMPSPYLADSIERQSLTGRYVLQVAPTVYEGILPLAVRLREAFHAH
jgi:membrane protein required for colicin V production